MCSGTCSDGAGEGGGSDWSFHPIDAEGPWQAGGAGGPLMGWNPFGSPVGDAGSSFVALFGHSEYWQQWTKRLLDNEAVIALEENTPVAEWGSWEPWEWLGTYGSKWVGACDETSACGATGAYLQDRWNYWTGHPREYVEGLQDKADKAQLAAQVGAALGGAGGGPGPAFAPVGAGGAPTPALNPLAPPALFASNGGDSVAEKWHEGSYDSPEESLEAHFEKHGAELGAKDSAQYLRQAEGFARNLRGAVRGPVDGYTDGVMRYVKNGRYIDIAPDGRFVSFGRL